MSDSGLLQMESEDSECPSCGSLAEPELDGEHSYFVCTNAECGFEFGYTRVSENVIQGNCAIGVPETIRRQFSNEGGQPDAVPVTLGRKSG